MIRPETFDFLAQLALNNNRDWFQEHKALHDAARTNVLEFTAACISGISAFDKTVPADLDPRSCVMRIYRDVRFSKDKTPYKDNFGAGISPQSKSFNGPGYYIHIHPSQSFIAGGCWMPEAGMLKAIRQEIDYNSDNFHSIIDDLRFKNYFGDPDQEHKLKSVAKGYTVDHPEIEFLKLKSFTYTRAFSASEFGGSKAVNNVITGFEKLHPFMVFLRNAIS